MKLYDNIIIVNNKGVIKATDVSSKVIHILKNILLGLKGSIQELGIIKSKIAVTILHKNYFIEILNTNLLKLNTAAVVGTEVIVANESSETKLRYKEFDGYLEGNTGIVKDTAIVNKNQYRIVYIESHNRSFELPLDELYDNI